jgi:hypothetical protein
VLGLEIAFNRETEHYSSQKKSKRGEGFYRRSFRWVMEGSSCSKSDLNKSLHSQPTVDSNKLNPIFAGVMALGNDGLMVVSPKVVNCQKMMERNASE